MVYGGWQIVNNPINCGVKNISYRSRPAVFVCVRDTHTQLASSVIEHLWLKPGVLGLIPHSQPISHLISYLQEKQLADVIRIFIVATLDNTLLLLAKNESDWSEAHEY